MVSLIIVDMLMYLLLQTYFFTHKGWNILLQKYHPLVKLNKQEVVGTGRLIYR